MNDNKSLEKIRECFNESIFSTEISSRSQLQHDQSHSKNLVRISSKFTDEPQTYLKKIKMKRKEASKKCLEALKNTVKAKMNLDKTEKDAAVSRYDFMKLYDSKKFKLELQSIRSSHKVDDEFNYRQSIQKIRRQHALNHLSVSARKEQTIRNIENLYQINKNDKSIFRQSLRWSQEKTQQRIQESAERIKKDHANFTFRKKNLTELLTTKSKFNYLSKINEEMQVIKDYQQMIDFMNSDDPEQVYTYRSSKFAQTFTGKFT